jgi:GSH-dependent disulfide-bond oxidoreductase
MHGLSGRLPITPLWSRIRRGYAIEHGFQSRNGPSGVGPYFGQAVHFRVYAPEKISCATNRYVFEAQRYAGILDARLAKQKYMLGDTYTIVDMNVWGWARLIPTVLGDGGWEKFPNLKRLADEISARPAAQRATALKERHQFKTEMDAEAMPAMFPHLSVKVG